MPRSTDASRTPPPRVDYGAGAWNLVLPAARTVLCQAREIPNWLRELGRRGVAVDVLASGDLRDRHPSQQAESPNVRVEHALTSDRRYDLVIFWDPATPAELRAWMQRLSELAHAPGALAVWSRNPWSRGARTRQSPHWLLVDRALARAGWRTFSRHLALPTPERVRQVVEWGDWPHTPLVRHGRRQRGWKRWIAHHPAYRWLLPARLVTASRGQAAPTVLDRVLEKASRTSGQSLRVHTLLVSPNGVAIARVTWKEGHAATHAILKLPLVEESEPRVDNNAAALQWVAARAAELGGWAASPPRLLDRGASGPWGYTLEECVDGTDLQSWPGTRVEPAMELLVEFLERLAGMGGTARCLDAERLEGLFGRVVADLRSLLQPDLAQRLQEVWEWVIQTLDGAAVPFVPRHGDFKLENVFGDPSRPQRLRLLDWELWTPSGLPLLDVLHLVASRRARKVGASMGGSVQRWLLSNDLTTFEQRLVHRVASGLDQRYVQAAPLLYWLERLAPMVARTTRPSPRWIAANVVRPLDAMHRMRAEVRV